MNIRVMKAAINIGYQQLDHEKTSRFGLFGYSYEVPSTFNISFEPGDTFSIMQTWTQQNRYRLLYQSGVSKQYVCWSFRNSPQNCGWVDDYPLMAIETGMQYEPDANVLQGGDTGVQAVLVMQSLLEGMLHTPLEYSVA